MWIDISKEDIYVVNTYLKKELNITNQKENAYLDHNEVLLNTCYDSYLKEKR
jgi:hypothetical protein